MDINKLLKILLSDDPYNNLKSNEDELFIFIPDLKICKGFNQNNPWHIYDVYEHILHVVNNVSCDITLRLAALFHDIGKPLSYTVDENKIGHFYGHWEKSKEIFDSFAIKYELDEKLSKIVSKLIYYHDANIYKLYKEDKNRFLSLFSKMEVEMIYEIKRADLKAQNSKYLYELDRYEVELEELLKLF